jgi:hypothetical protein
MDVQTAYDLSVIWYQNRMSEDWVPASPAEAEAIFDRFGLTSRFWRLS